MCLCVFVCVYIYLCVYLRVCKLIKKCLYVLFDSKILYLKNTTDLERSKIAEATDLRS